MDWSQHLQDSHWLKGDDTGSDEAEFIMKAVRLRPGDSVMDAPCGAGRIAVHIAKAGCLVTGIDINPRFIARAQQRFVNEKLDANLMVLDMRAIDFHNEFDAIYNWSGSFGYYSDEENANLLKRMAMALKPGGYLLIDQPNRVRLLRHFAHEYQVENAVRRNRWDAANQRVESVLYVENKEQPMTFSSVRLYTPAQIKQLLAKADLSLLAMYGSQDSTSYTRTSRRIIIVAKKAL